MSDKSESEETPPETEGGSSTFLSSHFVRSAKLATRRKDRKARFLTVTSGIKTPHFGSLSRKRCKSSERQLRTKSEPDFQVNKRDGKIIDDGSPMPEDEGSVTPRPDSGYCDGGIVAALIKHTTADQCGELLRKISFQGESIDHEGQGSIEGESPSDRYMRLADSKIQELIKTEETYVQNLTEIVEGYLKYMESSLEIPKPEGMITIPNDLKQRNKYRIIFGNIRDIFEYHKKTVLPELEKSRLDVTVLEHFFSTRKDSLKMKYGRFCLNKPKSEYIITEHQEYFSLIRMAQDFQHNLNSQLMTPIQRVTRYPLLLQEVAKLYNKAGDLERRASVMRAFDVANEVAEYANNMMTAGRIAGFWGDVTRQGLLLMCGNVCCYKRRHALKKPKIRACQMFVFQESIIVCEKEVPAPGSHSYRPQLTFWTSFQINKVIVREVNRGPDTTARFELERREDNRREILRTDDVMSASASAALSPTSATPARNDVSCIVVQCESETKRDQWLKVINDQIKELQALAVSMSNPPKSGTNK